jgi:hypothetical protein
MVVIQRCMIDTLLRVLRPSSGRPPERALKGSLADGG